MSAKDLRAYLVALLVTLAALFATTTLLSPDVEAQSTGGSFGGGDWGSSGGSDWGSSGGSDWGSSGGGWGSSGGSDWGSSGGSSYGGGGGGGGIGCCGLCAVLGFLGVVVLVILISQRRGGGGPGAGGAGFGLPTPPTGGPGGPMGGYLGPNAMYVSAISLGLDWRARAALQAHLKRLAETGDTHSPAGLAQLLSEVVLALRRNELSWLYAAYRDEGSLAPANAQPTFGRLAQDYRSRFRSEVVRAAGGGAVVRADAPAMAAQESEGEGTVVVTIVVAARRPLQSFHLDDANQIRAALSDRGALLPQQLVALEVIWSPAEENDRMSSAELEAVYPELKLIDPNSIAGRIFCAYCKGPFAAELLNCPHCGAPATESQGRRSPRG